MTHPLSTVEAALQMHADGANFLQISHDLGVARATVRNWVADPDQRRRRLKQAGWHNHETCSLIDEIPWPPYAYLFGQYLGDGCISEMGPRGVFRLRIATCDTYTAVRQMTMDAISLVLPQNKVNVTPSIGCSEVGAYSKHWPCLIPQHGPGKKHERDIVLAEWQQDIVEAFPREFLTGLIHSDGCRALNRIKRNGNVYEYPRYFFTNSSADILGIFTNTCDQLGVEWKQNRWNSISVARSDDVAYLDQFIGPKT